MANIRHKKNQKIEIIETGYLAKFRYGHHPSGIAKIVDVIPRDEWLSPLIPEYEITINRKHYIIPQYSIQEK